MINFHNGKELPNRFAGSELKKTLLYEGKEYLVKFPDPTRKKALEISYINNTFSEYIGSKIFESAGIPVQNVLLGTYLSDSNKEKIVCACEDFTSSNERLVEFNNMAISNIEAEYQMTTDIHLIEESIYANKFLSEPVHIIEKFWNMFIIDALIGNVDRHNSNWGFLENMQTHELTMAPVYDCGSSLFSLDSDMQLGILLSDDEQFRNRAYNVYSCLKENGKRIQYAAFMEEMKHEHCNKAMMRMLPYIDMQEINTIVNETEFLSEQRKAFYNKVLEFRYEKILLPVYKKLLCIEKENKKETTKEEMKRRI